LKVASDQLSQGGQREAGRGWRPLSWWQAALSDFAATVLPAIHQDPFDRALIAQAIVEGLKLVTTDTAIGQYAGQRLRVVR
jgi:PIN domain nuclease of toxin-antitoxin system